MFSLFPENFRTITQQLPVCGIGLALNGSVQRELHELGVLIDGVESHQERLAEDREHGGGGDYLEVEVVFQDLDNFWLVLILGSGGSL